MVRPAETAREGRSFINHSSRCRRPLFTPPPPALIHGCGLSVYTMNDPPRASMLKRCCVWNEEWSVGAGCGWCFSQHLQIWSTPPELAANQWPSSLPPPPPAQTNLNHRARHDSPRSRAPWCAAQSAAPGPSCRAAAPRRCAGPFPWRSTARGPSPCSAHMCVDGLRCKGGARRLWASLLACSNTNTATPTAGQHPSLCCDVNPWLNLPSARHTNPTSTQPNAGRSPPLCGTGLSRACARPQGCAAPHARARMPSSAPAAPRAAPPRPGQSWPVGVGVGVGVGRCCMRLREIAHPPLTPYLHSQHPSKPNLLPPPHTKNRTFSSVKRPRRYCASAPSSACVTYHRGATSAAMLGGSRRRPPPAAASSVAVSRCGGGERVCVRVCICACVCHRACAVIISAVPWLNHNISAPQSCATHLWRLPIWRLLPQLPPPLRCYLLPPKTECAAGPQPPLLPALPRPRCCSSERRPRLPRRCRAGGRAGWPRWPAGAPAAAWLPAPGRAPWGWWLAHAPGGLWSLWTPSRARARWPVVDGEFCGGRLESFLRAAIGAPHRAPHGRLHTALWSDIPLNGSMRYQVPHTHLKALQISHKEVLGVVWDVQWWGARSVFQMGQRVRCAARASTSLHCTAQSIQQTTRKHAPSIRRHIICCSSVIRLLNAFARSWKLDAVALFSSW